MIVIWILINGIQDITLKNYEQNSLFDDKGIKVKVKEISKQSAKK